jgi:general secretion pathway protein D
MKILLVICLFLQIANASDYIKINLETLANRVSKQINKNIYLDEDLNSTVSLFIPQKIDDKDLFSVFQKSIFKSGFVLYRVGNTYYLHSKTSPTKNSYIYHLKYNSNKDAEQLLNTLNIKYKYLKNINSYIIYTTAYNYKNIISLLSQIDQKQKQVILKIMIFEYTEDKAHDVGIQLGSIYKDITSTTQYAINSIIASVASNGISLSSNSFYSAIKLLDSNSIVTVKQFPFIVAKNNQKFSFSAVTNVPYLVSTTTTEATNTSEQNSIQYKDVGLKISGDTLIHKEYITLNLNLILQDFVGDTISQTPTTYKRTLESNTNIDYGHVLIISGLKRYKHITHDYSIPYLKNIPFLGKIFQYKTKSSEIMNISIAIQVLKSDRDSLTSLPSEVRTSNEEAKPLGYL